MSAPGGMEHHYGVVVATPVLLAWATAFAVLCLGRGKAGRVMAAVGMVPVFAVQTMLLAPDGIAWRCRGLHVVGTVFVDPVTIAAALVLGVLLAARGDPWRNRDRHPAQWCLHIGLALALPTIAIPLVILLCEADLPKPVAYRPLRIGLGILITIAAFSWPIPALATMLTLVVATTPGIWRWSCLVAVLALAIAHLV